MHLFKAVEFSGILKEDCDEGVLEWLDKDILPTLDIWEGDKIFLELLDKDVPFFSLKLCYEYDRLISHTLEY